jgi:hypothetical protein
VPNPRPKRPHGRRPSSYRGRSQIEGRAHAIERRLVSAPALAALLAALALTLTTDERSFGLVTDGQQMLSASLALTRADGLGVSRDNPTALPRASGDAVSRYGLGQPVAEMLPMFAARLVRAAWPALPTLPLFVVLPIGCLTLSAWATARAAEAFGASRAVAVLAGLALPLATPLWGYAGSDLSEPLQAACVAVSVAAAVVVRLGAAPRTRWEAAAGAAAGLALLTKSVLVVAVLPFLVAVSAPLPPAAAPQREKDPANARWRWCAFAVFAPWAAGWAALEIARFGRLFGGYPGEGFTFPPLEGVLRLTVFPNKGLVFYAPLVLLAPVGFVVLRRVDRLCTFALGASALATLASASAWWAWDGQVGWGPRLLVPALPVLVVFAAAAAATRPRFLAAFAALAALGVGVNLQGVLVPYPATDALVAIVAPPPLAGVSGRAAEAPSQHLARNPSWNPIRLHARLLVERLRGGDVSGRLAAGALTGFEPAIAPTGPLPAILASPQTVGFLGRSWVFPLPGGVDPYDWAVEDQRRRAADRAKRRLSS